MNEDGKQCSKCGKWKPYDNFHKRKLSRDGYRSQCNKCKREYDNRPEVKERRREYMSIYTPEYNNRPGVSERQREQRREYKQRPDIKKRRNEYRREYRQRLNVKEQRREYALEYNQRPNSKEYQRKYKQRPEVKERRREQARKHKERRKIYNQNRNARKRSLPDTLTLDEWQHALNYFDGGCAVCKRQLNDMFGDFKVNADHWVPITYSGDDNPGTVSVNMIPLCKNCNLSKSNTMPAEWLEHKFGKRKAKQIAAKIQAYFDSLR